MWKKPSGGRRYLRFNRERECGRVVGMNAKNQHVRKRSISILGKWLPGDPGVVPDVSAAQQLTIKAIGSSPRAPHIC